MDEELDYIIAKVNDFIMGDYGMIPYVRTDSQAEEEIDVLRHIP